MAMVRVLLDRLSEGDRYRHWRKTLVVSFCISFQSGPSVGLIFLAALPRALAFGWVVHVTTAVSGKHLQYTRVAKPALSFQALASSPLHPFCMRIGESDYDGTMAASPEIRRRNGLSDLQ